MTSHPRLRQRTLALVLALTYASLITQLPLTSHAVEVRKIEAAKLERKPPPLDKQKVMNELGKTPISFEANHGQAQHEVKFLARGSSYSVLLGTKEAVLQLEHRTPQDPSVDRQATSKSKQQARISMKFIGANSNPRVTGQNEISGKSNYFLGKDPKQWRTNVTNYSQVRYQEIYQGIDLVFYGQEQDLEYDFIVAPGADPSQIRLEFKGADKVSVDAQGDLVLQTRAGELRHRKPFIYQEVNGERRKVEGRYTLRSKRQVGFELANHDRTKELMIDPVIAYSTLLGGSSGPGLAAWANGIAIYEAPDGKVYVYVVGMTTQMDFPVRNPLQPNFGGTGPASWDGDVFVTKLDMSASSDASLIYSTYLGGSNNENGAGVAIDSAGNAYVTGYTTSTNFPIFKAIQSSLQNPGFAGLDAFVTALSPDGSSLIYSTYLGGASVDTASAIAVDGNGNAYIRGRTESQDFPIVNGLQTTNQSPYTYFIAKVAPPSGATPASLAYSTYLNSGDPINPGDVDAGGNGIAVDSAGNVFVTGVTASTSFPILNGFQTTLRCPWGNAFLIKLNPTASGLASLMYSTYLGGSCNNFIGSFVDAGRAVAVDASGNAYVTGVNLLEDFPISAGAFMSIRRNGWTTFVAKIDPSKASAASLIYSTLLGGSGGEASTGIAVDSQGNAYVTGDISSADFPLVNSVQSFNSGVFQSIDDGSSWTKLNNGMMVSHISSLVIDSSSTPRTLYASARDVANGFSTVAGGVFKTTNGGVSWAAINNGLTNTDVRSLLISPSNPSTIYAGTGGGVFVSNDGGFNWSSLNAGLSSEGITTVNTLAADSNTNNGVTTVTLYLGTEAGLFKLVEGSNTWSAAGHNLPVASIAIDSKTTPHTLYATRIDVGAYVSTDGGANWNRLIYPAAEPTFLAVDTTTTPSTLYAVDQYIGFLWRRSPNDFSWQGVDTQGYGAGDPVSFIIDERTTPSTLYIADLSRGIATSSDGGNSWTEILRTGVSSMAIDKASSSIPTSLYAGVGPRYGPDCFVARLNSTGSALLFSTVVGDIGSNFCNGIALDSLNNIYIAGKTQGGPFPTVNAFQSASRGDYTFGVDAFALKLGSASLPSTSATNVTTEVVVQTGKLALDFPNITGSTTGNPPVTTVDPLSSVATANLTLSNNLGAYDIKTTATVNTSGYASDPTQGIKLTFTVPVVNDESVFNALVITHGEDQNADGIIQPDEMIPYNGTIDPNKVTGHDFASRTIWVYVPSLSPFVIVKGVGDQIADLIRLVDSLNLKAGIENSLDKKLENAFKAYQAAQAKQRATACNVMGAFINETQAQTNKSITQSQANQLITAANQINVVLGCR